MATLSILLGNPAVNHEISIKVKKVVWLTVATAKVTAIGNQDDYTLKLSLTKFIKTFAPGKWDASYHIQLKRLRNKITLETVGEVNEDNIWSQIFDVRKDQPTSVRLKDEIFPQQKIDLSREGNETLAELKGFWLNPDIKLC